MNGDKIIDKRFDDFIALSRQSSRYNKIKRNINKTGIREIHIKM